MTEDCTVELKDGDISHNRVQLETIASYARHAGVNASTISRQLDRGRIPFVEVDGKRMIDRVSADSARRRNSNIAAGHGGKPDRAIRRQSAWKARTSTGYDPAVRACLDVMQTTWPDLLSRGMELLGASEIDQARACLVLDELIGCLACSVHEPFNRGRVHDYRIPIEEFAMPEWQESETREFVAKWGDDGSGGLWMSDEPGEGLPGGSELMDDMMSASWQAKP